MTSPVKKKKNSLLSKAVELFLYIQCSFPSPLAPFEQTFCASNVSIIKSLFPWFSHIYFLDCYFFIIINSFPWIRKAFRVFLF